MRDLLYLVLPIIGMGLGAAVCYGISRIPRTAFEERMEEYSKNPR